MSVVTENIVTGDYQPYLFGGDLFLSGYLRFEAAFESLSPISAAVMAEVLSVVAVTATVEEPAVVVVTLEGVAVVADGAVVIEDEAAVVVAGRLELVGVDKSVAEANGAAVVGPDVADGAS